MHDRPRHDSTMFMATWLAILKGAKHTRLILSLPCLKDNINLTQNVGASWHSSDAVSLSGIPVVPLCFCCGGGTAAKNVLA